MKNRIKINLNLDFIVTTCIVHLLINFNYNTWYTHYSSSYYPTDRIDCHEARETMKSLYQAAVPLPTVHLHLTQECHFSNLFFPSPLPLPFALEHAFGDDSTSRAAEIDKGTGHTIRCILNAGSPLSIIESTSSQTRVSTVWRRKRKRENRPRGHIMPMNEFLLSRILIIRRTRVVEAIFSTFRANSSPANFFPRLAPSFLRYLLIFTVGDFFFSFFNRQVVRKLERKIPELLFVSIAEIVFIETVW